MDIPGWIVLLFLVIAQEVRLSDERSCNYNNLHALYGWSLVKSPSYPKKFPAQTQCSWKISAPPQYKIQLEITDFSLVEPNSQNRCIWQWLNVVDGIIDPDDESELGQPSMLTLCGTNRPRIVISSGNILRLNLHSNAAAAASSYRGFSARYKYTTDDAFMPSSMSNLMPSSAASPGKPADSPSSSVSKSVGDSIKPFETKSRRLPPNPNAVLTLKNRRTEAKNRARNEAENSQNNNGPVYYRGGRNPSSYTRPTTRIIPTLANNIIQQDELPSRRSKPLPHEIKILLAVLGTVGAIILIIYLVKKFAYDKAHKKSSGKIMHAYAHFRHFKKKRKNKEDFDDVESKVNTISASIAESANGTLKTRDSGVASSNEHSGKEQSHVMHPRRTHPRKSETFENFDTEPSRKDTEAANVSAPINNDNFSRNGNRKSRKHVENEQSNSSSGNGHREHRERRRRRRHTRTETREAVQPNNTARPQQSRTGRATRERSNGRAMTDTNDRAGRNRAGNTGRGRHRHAQTERRGTRHHGSRSNRNESRRRSISDYSSDDRPENSNKKSWRDRAYS